MKQQPASVVTHSAVETEQFGQQLGARLRGGEVIELSSDVGGGKTTLVRGIARGAESSDVVASPTFTVSKQYDAKDFLIVHFDFYRIQHDTTMVAHELAEATLDVASVVLVEWSETVRNVLPKHTATITIEPLSEESRRISWQCAPESEYLFEELAL